MRKFVYFCFFASIVCLGNAQTHKPSFIPKCAFNNITMSEEEIWSFLDSIMSCYNFQQGQYSLKITPKYETENPSTAYMSWYKDCDFIASYIWDRIEIVSKKKYSSETFHKFDLLKYLYDKNNYEVRIKPPKTYNYETSQHQTDVGFSDKDWYFYVKKTVNKTILMVEHQDNKYDEARILHHHGNCDYDKQFGEMMIRLKDGQVLKLPNVYPLHSINCDDIHCHDFTDQFDLTGINVKDIIKIRLSDATDNFDFENEYMFEMLDLMIKAATKNLEESLKANEF